METTETIEDKNISVLRTGEEERKLTFKDVLCGSCCLCEKICPVNAIEVEPSGAMATTEQETTKIKIDQNICVLCGMCASICPYQALDMEIEGKSIKEIEGYPHLIKSAEISDELCIYCKACETACPRDAIVIARELPERSKLVTGEIEIDKETCIDCGICEEMCPADAITMEHKEPTSDSPTVSADINVNKDKCVYCLVCKKACPVDAIKASCRICSYGDYDLNPVEFETIGSSFIDDELCVECGWCQEICPVDAATVEKAFEGTITYDAETCQGCETCVKVCPCNVLSFPQSAESGDKPDKLHIDEKYCIYCGACAESCAVDAITVKRTGIKTTPIKSKSWEKAYESIKN